jgi:predicted alpha/beta hydrolase family esterase
MPFSLADVDVLLVPGRGNSNEFHWMSAWAGAIPNSTRLLQANWEKPDPADWIARLDAAVLATPRRVVIVGHSLAVATTVKIGRAHV